MMTGKSSRFLFIVFFSFFGVGFFPFGQGTLASFLVCLIYLLFRFLFQSYPFEFFSLLVVMVTSFALAPRISVIWKERDPSCVVIDEVVGMMLSLLFLPKNSTVILVAFVVFRFLDISKFPPINVFDKIKSPYGVVLDDVVAGIITNVLIRVLMLRFPFEEDMLERFIRSI